MTTGALLSSSDVVETVSVGVVAGFAPYLALRVTARVLGVAVSLGNLRAFHLPLLGLGTAIGSALIHNLLYSASGRVGPHEVFASVAGMAMGDFLGVLVVTGMLLVLIKVARRGRSRQKDIF